MPTEAPPTWDDTTAVDDAPSWEDTKPISAAPKVVNRSTTPEESQRINAVSRTQQVGREAMSPQESQAGLGRMVDEAKSHPSSILQLPLSIAGMPFSLLDEALPHLTGEERQSLAKTSPGWEKTEAGAELLGKIAPYLIPIGAGAEKLTAGALGKIIGGTMAAGAATQMPEVSRQMGTVFGNPKSTAGQKILATGDVGMTAAMAGLGAMGLGFKEPRPSEVHPEVKQTIVDAANILPASAEAAAKEVLKPEAQKGVENAIQERISTPPNVGQTPKDSGEVGARVSGPEEPAKTQEQPRPDAQVEEQQSAGPVTPKPVEQISPVGKEPWYIEEMKQRGLDPKRLFNDVDIGNPSVIEAVKSDPTLTDDQKAQILKTGSAKPTNKKSLSVQSKANPYLAEVKESHEGDLIGRMESQGDKLSVTTTKGIGKDYAQRVRDLRSRSALKGILASGDEHGQSLDELADKHGFESTDDFLDALEGTADSRKSMAKKAQLSGQKLNQDLFAIRKIVESKDLAKSADAAAKEVLKPAAQKGVENAIKNSQTTTVHGPLREQPVEGARQMPVKESGEGIQPRPDAQAEEQQSEEPVTPKPVEQVAPVGKEPQKFYQAGKSDRGGWQYVADDKSVADQFAEGGKFGRKGAATKSLSGDLKIFDATKATPEERKSILGKAVHYIEPDGHPNFPAVEDEPGLQQRLKDAGYDAIKVSEGENGTSIAVHPDSYSKLTPTNKKSLSVQSKANPYLAEVKASHEGDLIGRMESQGDKLSVTTTKGIGKDYAQRVRDLRSRSALKGILASGDEHGQSLDELADKHGFESTDDFLDALEATAESRKSMVEKARLSGQKLNQDQAFADASTKPTENTKTISSNDLNVGHKIKVGGEWLEVTHIDPDTEAVTVKDGPKFGRQELPANVEIQVEAKKALPKLRSKENQGDIFAATQEPFNLAGQKGVDTERVAAEKVKTEASQKANTEFQAKHQQELKTPSILDTLGVKDWDDLDAKANSGALKPAQVRQAKAALEKLSGKKQTGEEEKPIISMGGLAPADPMEPVGKVPTGKTVGFPGDIHGIAQRVLEARAAHGNLESIEPGKGTTATDQILRGRQLLAEGKDPEATMRLFEETKQLSSDDLALARAHGEVLARLSRKAEEQFGSNSQEFKTAWEAESAWAKRMKPMATASHELMVGHQAETDIDTGDVLELRRAFRDDTGKDFTPQQVKAAESHAARDSKANDATKEAQSEFFEQAKKEAEKPSPTKAGEKPKTLADYKPGDKWTPQQSRELWEKAKPYITDGKSTWDDVRHKLAADTGLPVEDVVKGLTNSRRLKRLADDVWRKQYLARQFRNNTLRWLKELSVPGWRKALAKIPNGMFKAKVIGHGGVALATHAPMVLFQPKYFKTYVRDFGKMWKMVGSSAFYEQQMQNLIRDPNWAIGRQGGLQNDPFIQEGYMTPETESYFGKLTGGGNRGYSILKILRQQMFNAMWDSQPESTKIPEVAAGLADIANHDTGATWKAPPKALNAFLFAPRLEGSKVAWLTVDPARATATFLNWKNASPGEKAFALHQAKSKAWVFGTMYGALLANQAILSAVGSDQKINGVPESMGGAGFNPMKGDFLKFKVAGMDLSYGNSLINYARFPARLLAIRESDGGKLKNLVYPDESSYKTTGEFVRSQASPFASLVADLWFNSDWLGRQLPSSNRPEPKRLRAEGIEPYTWPEFAASVAAPIPLEDAIKEVWQYGIGASPEQIQAMRKAWFSTMVMAGTGARLTDDWDAKENK